MACIICHVPCDVHTPSYSWCSTSCVLLTIKWREFCHAAMLCKVIGYSNVGELLTRLKFFFLAVNGRAAESESESELESVGVDSSARSRSRSRSH